MPCLTRPAIPDRQPGFSLRGLEEELRRERVREKVQVRTGNRGAQVAVYRLQMSRTQGDGETE